MRRTAVDPDERAAEDCATWVGPMIVAILVMVGLLAGWWIFAVAQRHATDEYRERQGITCVQDRVTGRWDCR